MINYQQLLEQVSKYVRTYYKEHPNPDFYYHNIKHTGYVVKAGIQIAEHYQLSDHDFFIVCCAAWFHDIGYYYTGSVFHEQKGTEIAAEFLEDQGVDAETVAKIKKCILATKLPQSPEDLNEKIVCDADLFHLGTDEFKKKNKQIRQEDEAVSRKKVSKPEWRKGTIKLFEQHMYHTDYCRLLLNKKKDENLNDLRKKVAEDAGSSSGPEPIIPVAVHGETGTDGQKKKDKDRPERGIETMFRISSSNHQRLSDMADNKAHILITVNSIILSAIISLLLRRLEDHIYLEIPTVILLMVSLVTMVYSILATRPTIPRGTFTQKDIDEKKVNLLFFGNFYKMSLDDYSAGMWKTMEDKSFLYGSLIRDVYSQGIVLGRKYQLLRVAYNIFMFGLVISVAAFILASVIHGRD